MEDLEEVRARIARRKGGQAQRKILGDRQFNRLYRFAMTTMVLCALILLVASYAKQNPEVSMYFRENMDFSKAGVWIDQHVLKVIPFFDFQEDQLPVNVMEIYESLGDHQYRGDGQTIYAISSGIVTAMDGKKIIVSQDNGVQTTYQKFSEAQVALYDHIQQGEKIAFYEGQFEMSFFKDGQEVRYETAILD